MGILTRDSTLFKVSLEPRVAPKVGRITTKKEKMKKEKKNEKNENGEPNGNKAARFTVKDRATG
jgi:hypothetical protein